jgi:hypothetical protein
MLRGADSSAASSSDFSLLKGVAMNSEIVVR